MTKRSERTDRHLRWLEQAGILVEALPYMQRYSGRSLVIKYGGHAMVDEALAESFARDVVLLKQVGIEPVVVHGGGPQISDMLKRLSIKSDYVDGLRRTTAETMEVVEMVLGHINKKIVANMAAAGGRAVGISGKDAGLVLARKITRKADPKTGKDKMMDLGFVGEPDQITPTFLDNLRGSPFIPVITPVALGDDQKTYNINADTFAGALASSLSAKRFLVLTDVEGVFDNEGRLCPRLDRDTVNALIEDGTITGGMIPKIETCLSAVAGGVDAAVILDGRDKHAILLELFTEAGHGSLISGTATSEGKHGF